MDLNHSTNFIFYCLTAQKFRKALVENFCGGEKNQINKTNNPNNLRKNFTNVNSNTITTKNNVNNNKRYQLAMTASDKTFQKSTNKKQLNN
jgi:hypothetical protein